MWLAWIHLAQGVIILLLSVTKLFPVTTNYLTSDVAASELAGNSVVGLATRHLFDINLAYLIAGFFFVAAIAHGLAATVYRNRYEADLKTNTNKVRWIEYSLGAAMMASAVAVLSGVADLSTFIMIFALGIVMCLTGLAAEMHNQGKNKPNRLSFAISCVAGATPWVVLAIYAWGSGVYGTGGIPTFVYWIYASMFVLFTAFAANAYLQYKKTGKWADYLYGERNFMILSLVAKTLLAWQIFAGILRP